MSSISDLIAELDKKMASATPGEWNWVTPHHETHIENSEGVSITWVDTSGNSDMLPSDAEVIIALHNAYQQLRTAALAGETLAKAVEKDVGHNDDCMFCAFKDKQRDAALKTYRNAVKDV